MKYIFNNKMVLADAILPLPKKKTLIIARNIVLVLGFALLTAVCAKLKIEIGPVPVTMQTTAVLLSGILLGSKRGALSQISYLFMGLAGVPWFSRGGGLAYILSPTFGYIIGFVLTAFLVGLLAERGWDRKFGTAAAALLLGNILLYVPGLLWLAKFIGFGKILAVGFFPFILGDVLKITLAGLLIPFGWKIKKHN